MPRVIFGYDETTPEGNKIVAWLSRQSNRSAAIRALILSDMDKEDSTRYIVRAIEQMIDRKLRNLAVVQGQEEPEHAEDPDLAAKLDNLF